MFAFPNYQNITEDISVRNSSGANALTHRRRITIFQPQVMIFLLLCVCVFFFFFALLIFPSSIDLRKERGRKKKIIRTHKVNQYYHVVALQSHTPVHISWKFHVQSTVSYYLRFSSVSMVTCWKASDLFAHSDCTSPQFSLRMKACACQLCTSCDFKR